MQRGERNSYGPCCYGKKGTIQMNAIDDISVDHVDSVDTISARQMIPTPLNEEERKGLLSEMGKLAARARKQYPTSCRECDKQIVGLSRRKFCDQTCQRRHWRRRLADMNPGDALPPVE